MTKIPLLIPKTVRNLSVKEYLKETKHAHSANNIERVAFVPPRIGSSGYGSFQVTYKTPKLCPIEQ